MGIEQSVPKELSSNFSEAEIKRLRKRFSKLDVDKSGTLSREEIMSLPEMTKNPLARRVLDLFDTDNNGEVNFSEFVQGLSQFSVKGDRKTKLYFAFRIFDFDNDGFVSRQDLQQALKLMIGENLRDIEIVQLANRTIMQFDKEKIGMLSFEEFLDAVGQTTVYERMVVNV